MKRSLLERTAQTARETAALHRNKVIFSIARRMLISIWYILTKRETNLHFDEETTAYKKLTSVPLAGIWSWAMDEKSRHGMTPQQFAKYGLLRLGVGQDLERIVRGGASHRTSPTRELLALKPELVPAELGFSCFLIRILSSCEPKILAGLEPFNCPIKK